MVAVENTMDSPEQLEAVIATRRMADQTKDKVKE